MTTYLDLQLSLQETQHRKVSKMNGRIFGLTDSINLTTHYIAPTIHSDDEHKELKAHVYVALTSSNGWQFAVFRLGTFNNSQIITKSRVDVWRIYNGSEKSILADYCLEQLAQEDADGERLLKVEDLKDEILENIETLIDAHNFEAKERAIENFISPDKFYVWDEDRDRLYEYIVEPDQETIGENETMDYEEVKEYLCNMYGPTVYFGD